MADELPPHVLPVPRFTLAIHAVQILLAIIILGLDAYGIRWIQYNALIYSLVCTLCTIIVAIYMIASQVFVHQAYNKWAFLALNIWMVIFWIVDLGVVANLAALWSSPSCGYSYYTDTYYCTYGKRDLSLLEKRDTTTYTAYRGALVAGALFGAVQFVLWVASLIILVVYMNRHRADASAPAPPPTYVAPTNGQGVPMEKYGATVQPGHPQQPGQPQYVPQPQTYVQQPAQPMYPQGTGPQYTAPYPQQQEPINRTATVSPVTTAGYNSPALHTAELATPQPAGAYHNPNVSELMAQK
ncbi:uncharacterized protein BDR25DRAFT_345026 [Lindgomyces ingoldianus]|uniref:Uncharacterized protein n=1 Tax=Lindgomyces ingoldianus TaxID=673940 RepID=A0ACB6QLT3_9PLEO|nr:uncharacterized protein BDR25DRAFT_345026 [Lindgomyces ingoldianus]KAF2467262.1 hypothetical protein BDR25DRAFT_345026 [Lindgomyces ingoldianus]